MILPLTAIAQTDAWAQIYDAENRLVCDAYGPSAVQDARDLVNAINERAALKERIAHLEELIKRWR